MVAIKNLFENLSNIGMGESIVFTNTEEDLDKALNIIFSYASTCLIIKRADYLQEKGNLSLRDWMVNILRHENSFLGYILNCDNVYFENGDFHLVEKNQTNIELLAIKLVEIK